ncbi:unnamed protein product [Euphydryas editha]|uniref:Uncharacterized protein n=1 Tax=Euphydryas editha TaxID=104508 RepID=A0AAU9TKH9_EUPED|nr:unnamed protein product [Euphydryas editha]
MECAGCLTSLDNGPFLHCTRCASDYHLSKERKGGDNTNTPIRGVLPPSPQYNNVTLRSKVKVEQDTQADIIRSLRSETETLRANNISLLKRLAQMDQQFRSSNIEIQCVPENKQENLINTMVQLGRVIKCPIDEAKIHYCARLAKMNGSSPRPRSILVKFNSSRLRDEFLAASSRFNKNNADDKLNTSHLGIGGAKKSPIYVVEHLSPEKQGTTCSHSKEGSRAELQICLGSR